MSLNASEPERMVGWKPTSDDRGSLDILWSCLLTLVLCCWVTTYPNAGSPHDKWYHALLDKFNLAIITFLGPDFLFGIALGQFSSARQSVRTFRRCQHLTRGIKWKTTHAFFFDMGCVHLTAPDYSIKDNKTFPINAAQLHYLVTHDHVEFPDPEQFDIKERDSADTLSRVITLLQAIWFIVKEVSRVREGYPITTLELTTLSFCFITFMLWVLWYHKPSITKPQYLATKDDRTIEQIRAYARQNTHPDLEDTYYCTPLEFIDRKRFGIDAHWNYYVTLAHKLRVNLVARPITRRPWDRVPSDMWLCPARRYTPWAALVLVGFSVIFVLAWNFPFPTEKEKVLWRISSTYHVAFSVYGGVYYSIEMARFNRIKERRPAQPDVELANMPPEAQSNQADAESQQTTTQRTDRMRRRLARFLEQARGWRNISNNQDPHMEIPLRIVVPITITCFAYVLCRLYIYLEDLISLRKQPAAVYLTVNKFVPFLPGGA